MWILRGVSRLHSVLLLPVPVNGVSMCIAIRKPSEKACSLAFLFLIFFFTNSSYRDVRQAGIVATMFHANEIEKVKKHL